MTKFMAMARVDDFCHSHPRMVPKRIARKVCDYFEYCTLGGPKPVLRPPGFTGTTYSGTSANVKMRWKVHSDQHDH